MRSPQLFGLIQLLLIAGYCSKRSDGKNRQTLVGVFIDALYGKEIIIFTVRQADVSAMNKYFLLPDGLIGFSH